MDQVVGVVREIRIHPVKGQPGVELTESDVVATGLAGDRPKRSPVLLVAEADADARANLVLSCAPADLTAAVQGSLRVGTAALRVTGPATPCPGVYAEVTDQGRVRVGDPVALLTPPPGGSETAATGAVPGR